MMSPETKIFTCHKIVVKSVALRIRVNLIVINIDYGTAQHVILVSLETQETITNVETKHYLSVISVTTMPVLIKFGQITSKLFT